MDLGEWASKGSVGRGVIVAAWWTSEAGRQGGGGAQLLELCTYRLKDLQFLDKATSNAMTAKVEPAIKNGHSCNEQ